MNTTKHFNYQNKGYLFNDIDLKSAITPTMTSTSFNQITQKRRNLKSKLNEFNYESFIEKKNFLNEKFTQNNFTSKLKGVSYFPIENQTGQNKTNLKTILNNTFSHIDKINRDQENNGKSYNRYEKY